MYFVSVLSQGNGEKFLGMPNINDTPENITKGISLPSKSAMQSSRVAEKKDPVLQPSF